MKKQATIEVEFTPADEIEIKPGTRILQSLGDNHYERQVKDVKVVIDLKTTETNVMICLKQKYGHGYDDEWISLNRLQNGRELYNESFAVLV